MVVYLVQVRHSSYGRDSLGLLRTSVQSLVTNYLAEHCDDLMFMHHGEVNETVQKQVLLLSGNVSARFLLLPEEYRTVPSGTPDESKWVQPKRFTAGYRHMIRLYTIGLWQVVASEGYEYVMRMDEDSVLLSPITYNVFAFMRASELDYTYRLASWESGAHPGQFHAFLKRYLLKHNIRPKWLLEPCVSKALEDFSVENCGDLYGIYNNWFATRVSFWMRRDVQAFLQYVDSSHTIYTKRWNDILWHSSALQVFGDRSRVQMLTSFGYEHASYEKVVSKTRKMLFCPWMGGVVLGTGPNQSAGLQRLRHMALMPLCRDHSAAKSGVRPCMKLHGGGSGGDADVGGGEYSRQAAAVLYGSASVEQPSCDLDPKPYFCSASAGQLDGWREALTSGSATKTARYVNRSTKERSNGRDGALRATKWRNHMRTSTQCCCNYTVLRTSAFARSYIRMLKGTFGAESASKLRW